MTALCTMPPEDSFRLISTNWETGEEGCTLPEGLISDVVKKMQVT